MKHSKIVISLLLLLCMLAPMVLSACDLFGAGGETVDAESVVMSSAEVTITVGETEQLVATVMPTETTDKTVTYTSSAPTVATVDATGKVTAVAVGSAIIIATTTNGKTATCTVTVVAAEVPVTSVTLDKTDITLAVGGTDQLTATVLPADATNKSVIFTSSDPDVVTVGTDGTVTAIGAGSAAIIAITENGQIATCSVTVSAAAENLPTDITLSEATLELLVGANGVLTATVLPADAANKSVRFTSSNTAVATVDVDGNIAAVSSGTAVIIASTVNGKVATCVVTVLPAAGSDVPVTEVTVSASANAILVGGTANITATIAPSNATDKTVSFTSSNTDVAAVDENGVVTAVSAGTVTIIATTANGKFAVCTLSVETESIPVTDVTLNTNALTLTHGTTETLTATLSPSTATDKAVSFTSSNPAVATVDGTGLVTATGVGTATIVAVTANGKVATCEVCVPSTDVPATSVTLNNQTLALNIGGSFTLSATVAPSTATDKTVTYHSSNSSIVSVAANGKVTAVASGTAAIVAITENGKFATCVVTVASTSATNVAVTGVTLSEETMSLKVGGTANLVATIAPDNATNKMVSYITSDPTIATVNGSGVVTAEGAGVATIVAVTSNGKVDTCTVTVASLDILATGVTLNTPSLALKVGGTATLTATVAPSNATDQTVTYTSTNTEIVTVDTTGKVTAKAVGLASIVATTANGKVAVCTVSVTPTVVDATGVTLNNATLNLNVNGTSTLTATVAPTTTTDKSVTFTSSNTAVATVDGTGKVTAKAAGTATIIAVTANGKVATCTVTVASPDVLATGVTLNNTSLELLVNGTATLAATVAPSTATDKSVTFSSSNTAVATVDSTGKVTAKAAGTAAIVAITANGKFATCVVTVETPVDPVVPATGVTLNQETASLKINGTVTLTATVAPNDATDKTVSYTTSNASVATVSATGVVTAKAAGTAVIVVVTANGKTDTCTITVASSEVAVTGVTLNNTALDLKVGGTATLTATIAPNTATDKTISYTSTNTAVATVDTAGKVTAKAAGTATIVATTTNGKFAVCTVSVTATVVDVTGVTLNNTTLSLNVNDTATLTATIAPSTATDKTVTFTSSNTAVATVDSTGKVTANAAGTATIIAVTANGKLATCTVTVASPDVLVTGVTLNNTALDLKVNGTATLTATIAPSTATDKTVTFTSTNTAIATVDSTTGKVTAKALGTASIVATATNGKVAVCTVTVSPTAVTSVTLNQDTLSLSIGDTATLSATIAPSAASDKSVTYTSANTAVATVDSTGKVTAKAAGTATIVVAAANGLVDTCIVTVASSEVPVTGVTLNSTALDLKVGGTATLTATIAPTTATDKAVSYTSTNTAIVTVDSTGKVTAKAVGTASIVVTTTNGKFAVCTVSVTPTVVDATGVTLNVNTLDLNLTNNTTSTLTATVAPTTATDKAVTYTSSNTAVATVDGTGKVTAKGAGTAVIVATTANGKVATCTVVVASPDIPAESVTLDQVEISLVAKETATLTATVLPATTTDKSVTYTSSNTDVVTVDESGELTAVAPGMASIVVSTANGKYASCTVVVTELVILPTEILLSKTVTTPIYTGETIELKATVVPVEAKNKTVTFTSSAPTVASVTADGKITGLTPGTATIVAATHNGITAKFTVIVSKAPTYANELEWVFGMPQDGTLNSSTNMVSSYGVAAFPTASQFASTYVGANAFATSCFTLTGLTNPSTASQGGNYYRLDHSNQANYPTTNENIAQTRGYQTAGVTVRFCTDATKIALYAVMQKVNSNFKHMPAKGAYGFDVYVGTGTNRTWVATGGSALSSTTTVDEEITLPAGYKEVMIYFPQYAGVTEVRIGFPVATKDTTRLSKPAARLNSGNLCFYGTSITQGACSSRAGTSYTNILGRALDMDVRNLGFSGSAVGEQVIAEYIASLSDLSILVMDYDRNHNNGTSGQAALQAAHYPFYKTIRNAQPDLPIVFVTRPIYTKPTSGDIAMRDIVKATYDRAVAEGDTNVYFIDGLYYFTEDMTDMFTVDGTHPNDTGHFYMATKIYPVLKSILDSKS